MELHVNSLSVLCSVDIKLHNISILQRKETLHHSPVRDLGSLALFGAIIFMEIGRFLKNSLSLQACVI